MAPARQDGGHQSTNGGRTWHEAGAGYAEPTFATASAGWALVATGENRWNEESPIYTTRDGGLTWSQAGT